MVTMMMVDVLTDDQRRVERVVRPLGTGLEDFLIRNHDNDDTSRPIVNNNRPHKAPSKKLPNF